MSTRLPKSPRKRRRRIASRKPLLESLEDRRLLVASDGFQPLSDIAAGLETSEQLNQRLPIVDQPIGAELGFAVLMQRLADQINSVGSNFDAEPVVFFNQPSLATDIAGELDDLQISATQEGDEIRVELVGRRSLHSEATLGELASANGLQFSSQQLVGWQVDFSFEFLFGDAAGEFYFRQPALSVGASVDVDPAGMDVEYGLIPLSVENGLIQVDVAIDVEFMNQTGDAQITLTELQPFLSGANPSQPIENLLLARPESSSAATLDLRPSSEAIAASQSLQLTIADDNLFDEAAEVLTRGSGFQSLEVTRQSLDDAVLGSLQTLARYAQQVSSSDPMTALLPFSIDHLLVPDANGDLPDLDALSQVVTWQHHFDVSRAVESALVTEVEQYFASNEYPTRDGIVETLRVVDATADGFDVGLPSDLSKIRTSFAGDELRFQIPLSISRTSDVEADLGNQLRNYGWGVETPSELPFITQLEMDLAFGVNFSDWPILDTAAFVETTAASISGKIDHPDWNAGARLGVLGVDVVSGSVDLDLKISLDDLAGRNSIAELNAIERPQLTEVESSYQVRVPLQVSAGISGFQSVRTIAINDPDVFDVDDPVTDLSQAQELLDFAELNPDLIIHRMNLLAEWLKQLDTELSIKSNLLPFTSDVTLGDVVQLEDLVRTNLIEVVEQTGFETIQEFADLLGSRISNLVFDPTLKTLEFDLALQSPDVTTTGGLAFLQGFGELSDLQTESEVDVSATTTMQIPVKLDLRMPGSGFALGLTGLTSLSLLRDGQGIRTAAGADLQVQLRDGRSFEVDLSTAQTVADVISEISAAAPAGSLSVEVRPDGTGLLLQDLSSQFIQTFQIVALNASDAADDLGIARSDEDQNGSIVGDSIFQVDFSEFHRGNGINLSPLETQTRVTLRDGTQFHFDLSGLTTVSEAIARIEQSAPVVGSLQVVINDASTGLNLIDNTEGSGKLTIEAADGSLLGAFGLGLSGEEYRPADPPRIPFSTSPAEEAPGIIYGTPLHGETNSDLVAIGQTQLSIEAEITGTNLAATARFGFLDVEIIGGSAEASPTVSFDLLPSNLGGGDFASLFDLTNATSDQLIASQSLTGAIEQMTLPIQVAGSVPGLTVVGSPQISVAYPALDDPSTISISRTDFQSLGPFENVSDATVIDALVQSQAAFERIEQQSSAGQPLPFVSANAAEIAGLSGIIDRVLERYQQSPARSLQTLQSRLDDAADHDGTALAITVENDAIRFGIELSGPSESRVAPLSIDMTSLGVDLASRGLGSVNQLVDLSGTSEVEINAQGEVTLALGISLSDPTSPLPFIGDSTSASYSVNVDEPTLSFPSLLGTLSANISGGRIQFDSDGEDASETPAIYQIGLTSLADGQYAVDADFSASVESSLAGSLDVVLPLSLPDFGSAVDDLILRQVDGETSELTGPNIDTIQGTVEIRDSLSAIKSGFSQLFSGFEQRVNAEVFSERLPLLGDQLPTVPGFLGDVRVAIENNFVNLPAAPTPTEIRTALFEALGPGGLNVLSDVGGDGNFIAADEIAITENADEVKFDVQLHANPRLVSTSIPIDFGWRALGLEVNPTPETGRADVELGYSLRFQLGLSRENNLFLSFDGANDLTADVTARFDDSEAFGKLGALPIKLTNNDSSMNALFQYDLGGANGMYSYRDLTSNSSPFTSGETTVDSRIDFNLETNLSEGSALPKFGARVLSDSTGLIDFQEVRIELASLLQNVVAPSLEQIQRALRPFKTEIDAISLPFEIEPLNWLLGEHLSLADLLLLPLTDGFDETEAFAKAVNGIEELLSKINALTDADTLWLDIGQFAVDEPLVRNHSLGSVHPTTSTTIAFEDIEDQIPEDGPLEEIYGLLTDPVNPIGINLPDTLPIPGVDVELPEIIPEGLGASFPFLEDGINTFDVLLGRTDVDAFFDYDMPRIDFELRLLIPIPAPSLGIPVPQFSFLVGGGYRNSGDFAFGFDNQGLQQYSASGIESDLLDGFFASDSPPTSTLEGRCDWGGLEPRCTGTLSFGGPDDDPPEWFIGGGITHGGEFALIPSSLAQSLDGTDKAGKAVGKQKDANFLKKLGIGAVTGSFLPEIKVLGGVFGEATYDFADPNGDGVIRYFELLENEQLGDPTDSATIYDKGGRIGADLDITVEIPLTPFPLPPLGVPFTYKQNVVVYDWENLERPDNLQPDVAGFGEPGELVLNLSDEVDQFEVAAGPTADSVVITALNYERSGYDFRQTFSGVFKIVGDAGAGDDRIVVSPTVLIPIEIDGGSGNDELLAGGGRAILRGGEGIDLIEGSPFADELEGGAGDDTVIGHFGSDLIRGGLGGDILIGGFGDDFLYGEEGVDFIYGEEGDDTASGGKGADTIDGGFGADTISGDAGGDYISAGVGADVVYGDFAPGMEMLGEAGGDTLVGGDGADQIVAGPGNDIVRGGFGNDWILGGAGIDNLDGGNNNDIIDGGDGNDIIRGGLDSDDLRGGAGDDTIFADNDAAPVKVDVTHVIDGGAGDDTIFGSLGEDNITGGPIVVSRDPISGVAVETDNDLIEAFAGDDLIRGGDGDDTIIAGLGTDTVFGGWGADDIVSGDVAASRETEGHLIFGDEDNAPLPSFTLALDHSDHISGTNGDDVIFAGWGDDVVNAYGGDDHVEGGNDNDLVHGGFGNDVLIGGSGDDELFGELGDDIIWGGLEEFTATQLSEVVLPPMMAQAEQDRFDWTGFLVDYRPNILVTPAIVANQSLLGSAGDGLDLILGGAGNDRIFGGGDQDELDGGSGVDYVDGGAGNDDVRGGDGDDVVRGGANDDIVRGDVGIDQVYGDDGNDDLYGDVGIAAGGSLLGQRLFGGDGIDRLHAFALNDDATQNVEIGDELWGDGGNDFLFGNQRREFLAGGDGNDFIAGDWLAGSDYAVNLVDPHIRGGADWAFGGSGEDQLLGGGGDDLLRGGGDTDWIEGQEGTDTGHGGGGIDLLVLDVHPDYTTYGDDLDGHFGDFVRGDEPDLQDTDILLIEGTSQDDNIRLMSHPMDTNQLRVDYNGETIDGTWRDGTTLFIEQIRVSGLLGDDVLEFDPSLDLSALASRSSDWVGVLDGGPGNDSLRGTIARDRIDGGSGMDTIFGLAGDDQLRGGDGDDSIFAGQGNDDLIGGAGNNHLYAWTRDPGIPANNVTSAPASPDFGIWVQVNPDGTTELVDSNSGDLQQEDTGLNRILGGPGNDLLFGGTGLDFMYGNGGDDVLHRADGSTFESIGETLAGDAWKEYAKETNKVWYVGATNADDVISVDFVTEPGLLTDHHLVTRLTNNNGNFSFDAQVRLDFSATDENDDPIWDPVEILELEPLRTNDPFERQTLLADLAPRIERNIEDLIPSEGDFMAILIDALDGNDQISVGPTVQKTVWIDAGDGDDRVEILAGNAILIDQAEYGTRNDVRDEAYGLPGSAVIRPAAPAPANGILSSADPANLTLIVRQSIGETQVAIQLSPDQTDGTDGSPANVSFDDPVTALVDDINRQLTAEGVGALVTAFKGDVDGEAGIFFATSAVTPGSSLELIVDPTDPAAVTLGLQSQTAEVANVIAAESEFRGLTIDNPGDVDWFSFQLANPPALGAQLSLQSESEIDRLGVTIFQADSEDVFLQAQAAEDFVALPLQTLAANTTYFVRVDSPNVVPTIYSLTIDLLTPAEPLIVDLGQRTDLVRRDVILGGAGNDILSGGPSEDWIFGGPGNDVLTGGLDRQAPDLLFGEEGDDTFQLITDQLPTLTGTDATFLPTLTDEFDGGDGDDRVLFLGGDFDRLGNPVNDFASLRYNRFLHRYEFTNLVWDIANRRFETETDAPGSQLVQQYVFYTETNVERTVIDLQAGDDVFRGDPGFKFPGINSEWGIDPGDFQQRARIGAMEIRGGDGNDALFGGALSDVLIGGPGIDWINGSDGNDEISGGPGADYLAGNWIDLADIPTSDDAYAHFEFSETPTSVPPVATPESHRFELARPLFALSEDNDRAGFRLPTVPETSGAQVSVPVEEFFRDVFVLEGDAADPFAMFQDIGDLNGDGWGDFLSGGMLRSYVLLGPVELSAVHDIEDQANIIIDHGALGTPARRMGNINGDRYDDLVFVAQDTGQTKVTVVLGDSFGQVDAVGARTDWPRYWDSDFAENFLDGSNSRTFFLNDAQLNPANVDVQLLNYNGDLNNNTGRAIDDLLITSTNTVASVNLWETAIDSGIEIIDAGSTIYQNEMYFAGRSEADGTQLYKFDGQQIRRAIPTNYPAEVTADNPAFYWRLDESNDQDFAANRGHYLVQNSFLDLEYRDDIDRNVTGVLPGHSAASLNHPSGDNNRDDFLRAGEGSEFVNIGIDETTVELWLKTTATNSGTIVSFASNDSDNELLVIDPDDLEVWANGTSIGSTGINVSDGQWHHLAVTYRSSDGQVQIFIDGDLRHTATAGSGGPLSSGTIFFGQEQDSRGQYTFNDNQQFVGELDEIAVYHRVLDADAIRRHYEAVFPPTIPTTPFFSFAENSFLDGVDASFSVVEGNLYFDAANGPDGLAEVYRFDGTELLPITLGLGEDFVPIADLDDVGEVLFQHKDFGPVFEINGQIYFSDETVVGRELFTIDVDEHRSRNADLLAAAEGARGIKSDSINPRVVRNDKLFLIADIGQGNQLVRHDPQATFQTRLGFGPNELDSAFPFPNQFIGQTIAPNAPVDAQQFSAPAILRLDLQISGNKFITRFVTVAPGPEDGSVELLALLQEGLNTISGNNGNEETGPVNDQFYAYYTGSRFEIQRVSSFFRPFFDTTEIGAKWESLTPELDNVTELVDYQGGIYFVAAPKDFEAAPDENLNPLELFVLDQNDAFRRVSERFNIDIPLNPKNLFLHDGGLFFEAEGGLWKLDVSGNTASATQLSSGGAIDAADFFVLHDDLYFTADGGPLTGRELYRYDGETILLVEDVVAGPVGSDVRSPIVYGDSVFLYSSDNDVFDQAVSADQPTVRWKLDEAAGPTANAVVGVNGTYVGTPVYNVADPFGGTSAVSLNTFGTGDAIVNDDFPMPEGDFSVELWMRSDAVNRSGIVSYAVSGSANELLIYGADSLQIWLNNSGTNTGVRVNDGQWHHLVLTYDTSGEYKLYVDGNIAYTDQNAGGNLTGGGSLMLGQEQDSVGGSLSAKQAYRGDLDEFIVYDRVLTPGEISNHYSKTSLYRLGYPGNHGYVFSGIDVTHGLTQRGDGSVDHRQALTTIRGGLLPDNAATDFRATVVGDLNGDSLEDSYVADPGIVVEADGPAVVTGNLVPTSSLSGPLSATLEIRLNEMVDVVSINLPNVTSLADIVGELNVAIASSSILQGKVSVTESSGRLQLMTTATGPSVHLAVREPDTARNAFGFAGDLAASAVSEKVGSLSDVSGDIVQFRISVGDDSATITVSGFSGIPTLDALIDKLNQSISISALAGQVVAGRQEDRLRFSTTELGSSASLSVESTWFPNAFGFEYDEPARVIAGELFNSGEAYYQTSGVYSYDLFLQIADPFSTALLPSVVIKLRGGRPEDRIFPHGELANRINEQIESSPYAGLVYSEILYDPSPRLSIRTTEVGSSAFMIFRNEGIDNLLSLPTNTSASGSDVAPPTFFGSSGSTTFEASGTHSNRATGFRGRIFGTDTPDEITRLGLQTDVNSFGHTFQFDAYEVGDPQRNGSDGFAISINRFTSGDFNGDNKLDVALSTTNTGLLRVYWSFTESGGSLDIADADVLIPFSSAMHFATQSSIDLNGDRLDDLVLLDDSGQIHIVYGATDLWETAPVNVQPLTNRTITGSGDFVVNAGRGIVDFGVQANADGSTWFEFTTLGDGLVGDAIAFRAQDGLVGTITAQLYDERGRVVSPPGSVIDLAGKVAGTYSLLVQSLPNESFTIEFIAPIAGATLPLYDRDQIWGGDGDDTIAGNRDIDRIFGQSGNERYIGEPVELRDFDSGRDHLVAPSADEHSSVQPRPIDPIVFHADARAVGIDALAFVDPIEVARIRNSYRPTIIPIDFDGDQDMDVIELTNHGEIRISENDLLNFSYTILGQTTATSFNVDSLNVADIDGDGDLDVITAGDAGIYWYETQPDELYRNYPEHTISATAIESLEVADINGDGRPDIIVSDSNNNIVLFRNDGVVGNAVIFTEQTITTMATISNVVASAWGESQLPDLIIGTQTGIVLLENLGVDQGEMTFATHTVTEYAAAITDATELDFADIDGDGDRDIVAHTGSDATLTWYELLGRDEQGKEIYDSSLIESGGIFSQIQVTELNGDGRPDLLVTTDTTTSWYQNLGIRTDRKIAFQQHDVPGALTHRFLTAVSADMNGDDRTDLLISELDSNAYYPLRLFFNRQTEDFVPLENTIIPAVAELLQIPQTFPVGQSSVIHEPIYASDLAGLHELVIDDQVLQTLEGLEHAVNLEKLELTVEPGTDLSVIPKLNRLRDISIMAGGESLIATVDEGDTFTLIGGEQITFGDDGKEIVNSAGTEKLFIVRNVQPTIDSFSTTPSPSMPPAPPQGAPAPQEGIVNLAEGDSLTLTGTFVDPGADTWTIDIDFGDGQLETQLIDDPASAKSFHAIHEYLDEGTYTITIRVTDDDGSSVDHTQTVVVSPVAPTAELTHDPAFEGSPIRVLFVNQHDDSQADLAEGFVYSLEYSSDGGTQYTSLGTDVAESEFMIPAEDVPDGDGQILVNAIIQDEFGLETHILNYVIPVENVAPTGTLLSVGSVAESSIGRVQFVDIVDPSEVDHLRGFLFSFDFDSDGNYEVVDSARPFADVPSSFLTSRDTLSVTGRVRDKNADLQADGETTVTTVIDINRTPTAILLSNTEIAEIGLAESNLFVGTLSAIDDTPPEQLVFTLVDGFGDNHQFQIVGNQLQLRAGEWVDFETNPSFQIQVKVDDQGNGLINEFNIDVRDINEAPEGITLSSDSIDENVISLIGDLTVIDPDASPNFVLTVDHPNFEIVANQLHATKPFDHETIAAVPVVVTATDTEKPELFIRETFVIQIADVNEPPTEIRFSGREVPEAIPNVLAGFVTVIDPDVSDSHQITSSDSRFAIHNGRLKLVPGAVLDQQAEPVISLTLSAQDSGGLIVEKEIQLEVTADQRLSLVAVHRFDPSDLVTSDDALVFRTEFSEELRNIDPSDFVVTGGSTATVTNVAAVQGTGEIVYLLTVSGGNLASFNGLVGIKTNAANDLVDHEGHPLVDATPSPDESFTLDNIAPQVQSIQYDNDTNSVIRSVQVDFDSLVILDADAIQIRASNGTLVDSTTQTEEIDGKTRATVLISGSMVDASGSLMDGDYTLTVRDTHARDLALNSLDGNQNGSAGSPAVEEFFRLYGDADGNRVVDGSDLASFAESSFTRLGEQGYDSQFDYDADGDVDGLDFTQLQIRVNRRLG